ncbi:uncharacterized protein BP01DRAFT_376146 [Aspergillus saccharolyticus JOP 1030-1]|uniref:Uncharacterized protein n=1 Tax=Aspergillus saccharolyticus JOP 1030-1 TaxID=1450539 RepID=A0A318ZFR1_9EURO|nr:hypothetical protein BP01DRAFT_376146 [Aspergillus saccharolyticus JOP 1030-1]PYH42460.1 hypothetical protein BP01DRAFT_376146 [Aspergillus saccharolyticus JOP 1030-1]
MSRDFSSDTFNAYAHELQIFAPKLQARQALKHLMAQQQQQQQQPRPTGTTLHWTAITTDGVQDRFNTQASRILGMCGLFEEREMDHASLSQVSRSLHEKAIPLLYHTLRFHSRGEIDPHDNMLLKLDTFVHPNFDKLEFVRRVIVSGTWYASYASIDSFIAPLRLLSPAARMFSTILCVCIARMPNLEEFVWDMPVALTEFLVSNLVLQPMLRRLQLRMGTDCTPKPFFRPPLTMRLSANLTVLSLVQIDDVEVMGSLGVTIRSATNLRELTIWTDNISGISLGALFEHWPTTLPSNLHLLDLRGLGALGVTPANFWATMCPKKLTTLTLEFADPGIIVPTVRDFWDAGFAAGFRPTRLTTNFADDTLGGFLEGFSGLETLQITPIKGREPARLTASRALFEVLDRQHGATLRGLALNLPCYEYAPCACVELLDRLARTFPLLEELRIRQAKVDAVRISFLTPFPLLIPTAFTHFSSTTRAIKSALSLAKLRVLYIDRDEETESTTDEIVSIVEDLMRQGYGKELQYLANSEGTTHERANGSNEFSSEISLVGYQPDTLMLHERTYDWVQPTD